MALKYNLLLGVTGSVASTLTPQLFKALTDTFNIKVIATDSASKFFDQHDECFHRDYRRHLFFDKDEWNPSWRKGEKILHISLRDWASCILIAPLSANTLGKMANGLADNLLTSIIRAWDPTKPMVVAPAMNTQMWENPITSYQLGIIRTIYEPTIIQPIKKTLACGDVGIGAMALISDIVNVMNKTMTWGIPIYNCRGIPVDLHPGSFGFKRSYYYHTGVDLYCEDGAGVHAVEAGEVVNIEDFTGPSLGQPHWEETRSVLVRGSSGTVVYGEIIPANNFQVGSLVRKGQWIGNVKRVLPLDKARPDIPGHSTSMLHLELYKPHITESISWRHNDVKSEDLINPTEYLLAAFDKRLMMEPACSD
jgi:phosphopantothenoylcysteine decarboxylase